MECPLCYKQFKYVIFERTFKHYPLGHIVHDVFCSQRCYNESYEFQPNDVK